MITLGTKPDRSFDEPLGLMSDCHRRIERFLDQLIAVADLGQGDVLTDEMRQALGEALRYFAKAAPLHTQDEEVSLFPRLRDSQSAEARRALAAIEALEDEHQHADKAHAEIERLGRRWLETGTLAPEESQRLLTLLRDLRSVYRRHIAVEDTELFPLAQQVLEASELTAIGREMAQRRGLDPDNLPTVNRCAARRETR